MEGALAWREEELKGLMLRGLEGDARAQSALLTALVPILSAFFRRQLRGNEFDAEDLVQEVLIAVHSRRASFDRDRPLAAWIYAIARHKMVDHFRRARITVELPDDLAEPGSLEDAANARIDVDRLLEELPDKQAAAIRGTHLMGHSVAEHARSVGIGESDVKVSVHRGLKRLAARVIGGRQ